MTEKQNPGFSRNVIGLIPAAGQATRIAPLPGSKELYPVGFQSVAGKAGQRPKVVCHYLLEKMKKAEVSKAYIVLREGKWDIPAYLRDGGLFGMSLAYLIMTLPYGVPYTLEQAYPFTRDAIVTFGFPDILFEPDDAFAQLLSRLAATDVDVMLGLFPADQPEKEDMVEYDDEGRVREIVIKPSHTPLLEGWGIAVWTPAFTQFLHDYVSSHKVSAGTEPEISVGQVFQLAHRQGLRLGAMRVSDEPYLDIGTPEGLLRAVKRFSC